MTLAATSGYTTTVMMYWILPLITMYVSTSSLKTLRTVLACTPADVARARAGSSNKNKARVKKGNKMKDAEASSSFNMLFPDFLASLATVAGETAPVEGVEQVRGGRTREPCVRACVCVRVDWGPYFSPSPPPYSSRVSHTTFPCSLSQHKVSPGLAREISIIESILQATPVYNLPRVTQYINQRISEVGCDSFRAGHALDWGKHEVQHDLNHDECTDQEWVEAAANAGLEAEKASGSITQRVARQFMFWEKRDMALIATVLLVAALSALKFMPAFGFELLPVWTPIVVVLLPCLLLNSGAADGVQQMKDTFEDMMGSIKLVAADVVDIDIKSGNKAGNKAAKFDKLGFPVDMGMHSTNDDEAKSNNSDLKQDDIKEAVAAATAAAASVAAVTAIADKKAVSDMMHEHTTGLAAARAESTRLRETIEDQSRQLADVRLVAKTASEETAQLRASLDDSRARLRAEAEAHSTTTTTLKTTMLDEAARAANTTQQATQQAAQQAHEQRLKLQEAAHKANLADDETVRARRMISELHREVEAVTARAAHATEETAALRTETTVLRTEAAQLTAKMTTMTAKTTDQIADLKEDKLTFAARLRQAEATLRASEDAAAKKIRAAVHDATQDAARDAARDVARSMERADQSEGAQRRLMDAVKDTADRDLARLQSTLQDRERTAQDLAEQVNKMRVDAVAVAAKHAGAEVQLAAAETRIKTLDSALVQATAAQAAALTQASAAQATVAAINNTRPPMNVYSAPAAPVKLATPKAAVHAVVSPATDSAQSYMSGVSSTSGISYSSHESSMSVDSYVFADNSQSIVGQFGADTYVQAGGAAVCVCVCSGCIGGAVGGACVCGDTVYFYTVKLL